MNRKFQSALVLSSLGLALSISTAHADPSPSTCSSLLSLQPSYQNCQSNGATIRQCIQDGVASQITTSGSLSNQIQAVSNASQTLAQLDFQCQYYLAYGSQPSYSSTGPQSSGHLGSSLKGMLGIHSSDTQSGTTANSANTASTNQSNKLNSIQTNPPPASKAGSQKQQDDKSNNSNSINWF